MNAHQLDLMLENQSLKTEFEIRGLALEEIWRPHPEDLKLENHQLRHLLDWVEQYTRLGNRKAMEEQGYLFPPVECCIEPESDWLRFERWMQGKSTTLCLRDVVPEDLSLPDPESLGHEEAELLLEKLQKAFESVHYSIDLCHPVPPKLIYENILEELDDKVPLIARGWWHFDGCTGFCPECFQRPWCEFGIGSCWNEDEEAGEMYLIPSVRQYVSPTPGSLELLRRAQKQEEEALKVMEEELNLPF